MEKLLSLQKSVSATWLNFGSTTWAMDMILAFACGLGIFLLLLPFLPDNPPVPPPPPLRKKKGCRKYHMVRKDWCKIRKRSCALRARRDGGEEGEGNDHLALLLCRSVTFPFSPCLAPARGYDGT
ncbi:PREDICTED: spermatogenesis-associated protein 31E1-like isoform X2 [Chinchilla lanigera]|uniref:spermatogenesis-associated protein 31E1-like isoform X2 n=1 Tax=Chinchilla lanigera TaxID=34839 RepID=UPI000698A957|nr:PREDICTED: spermatogenesis-associated protein 31E1-like isoform X2 [Chinchilla lanigera]